MKTNNLIASEGRSKGFWATLAITGVLGLGVIQAPATIAELREDRCREVRLAHVMTTSGSSLMSYPTQPEHKACLKDWRYTHFYTAFANADYKVALQKATFEQTMK